MKALVIGATGLVGNSLYRSWKGRIGWEARGTACSRPFHPFDALDMRDAKALRAGLAAVGPDVVVLAASNPYVDYCETHPEETRAVNVTATVAAAEAARDAGARFVFFSSDYVFDGKKGPYAEGDPVAPLNEYGRQKAEAEEAIRQKVSDHLILRISGVFGWELSRKNFALQVVDKLSAGTPVQAADDIRYHPTYAADLPAAAAELVEAGAKGTFHACGPAEVSRRDLALEVARVFGLDASLVAAVPAASLKLPARRPARSSMSTDKLRRTIPAPMSAPRAALELMRASSAEWKAYSEAFIEGIEKAR